MRPSIRLLATAARAPISQYLTAAAPTGLTGLATHPCPRPSLIFIYNQTLDKLKQLPESSAYRKSTESLTQARLKIVTAQIPEGYDAWAERSAKLQAENPQIFSKRGGAVVVNAGKQSFAVRQPPPPKDDRLEEWDGEPEADPAEEGLPSPEEAMRRHAQLGAGMEANDFVNLDVELEVEPSLTAQQISEIETQIGAGLIEEVVEVAEGELKLVDQMIEAKVWEELEEKPAEGQWAYFERHAS